MSYYDDELIMTLFKETNLGDVNICNNYYEAMDLSCNEKHNKYYVRGLDKQGISSYVPSIYKFTNEEQLVVSISQIYDSEKVDKIHAWSIVIESTKNMTSDFTKIRLFCKFDHVLEKVNCDVQRDFCYIIEYLRNHIPSNSVHLQIIIDLV